MALGKGYFDNVGVEGAREDPLTYALTPKYNDPHASSDQDRAMAKFIISAELAAAMSASAGANAKSSGDSVATSSVMTKLNNTTRGYFDFFLQSAEEVFDEKYQIMETLADHFIVFGIGSSPRVFNYSGTLLNSKENDWRANFIRFYEGHASVSRLARLRALTPDNQITLVYDGIIARGAILGSRLSLRADNELATPFAFSMVVTKLRQVNIDSVAKLSQAPTPESQVNNSPTRAMDTPTATTQVSSQSSAGSPSNSAISRS